ncbi:MAG TPA: lactate dehydrogenase [Bacteroidales bacterium]|nr:lactate dehydrogenase [Bacteroidales bacterium]
MSIKTIPFDLVEEFSQKAFAQAGVPESDAQICAKVLVDSNRLGFESHGANRLKPIYLDRIKEGIILPNTHVSIIKEGPTSAVLDGNNGMGQVISNMAMKMAIAKAREFGLGMVVVRNSNHYGFAGFYPLLAVKEDMIGITGTNARPSIAPTFGVEPMLGTNPLTFGMPTDEPFPFLLDCATSIIQRGKVEIYARSGKPLSEGWAVNQQGESQTAPNQVLTELVNGTAALAPLGGIGEEMAGYKGYGYATVVEILSSALQQGAFLHMLSGIQNGKKVPYSLGHFFIAIDITAFTEPHLFKQTTGEILRQLRASNKAPGQNRIFTAGEKEFVFYENHKNTGIDFNEPLLKEFATICNDYNLPEFAEIFDVP